MAICMFVDDNLIFCIPWRTTICHNGTATVDSGNRSRISPNNRLLLIDTWVNGPLYSGQKVGVTRFDYILTDHQFYNRAARVLG